MSRYHVLLGADDDVGRWVHAQTRGEWIPGQGFAIGFTCNESLVAGVTFSMYNGANVWAGVASDPSHRGRWATRRNLYVIFDYPFRQLSCKRITALVYETNPTSQEFLEQLGFTREATLADAAPDGDMLVYVLTAETCAWHHTDKETFNERRRRQTASRARLRRRSARAGATER